MRTQKFHSNRPTATEMQCFSQMEIKHKPTKPQHKNKNLENIGRLSVCIGAPIGRATLNWRFLLHHFVLQNCIAFKKEFPAVGRKGTI